MKAKRVILLILSILTIFAMVACNADDKTKNTTNDTTVDTDTNKTDDSSDAKKDDTQKDDTQKDAEKIVLRMAWWGSQVRHDNTVKVIEMYEAQNPNVDIQYEFYDFDGYFTKLNTLVASNEVWDCFQLGGNFPTYLSKIVPLDDYIKSGIIDASKTTAAFLKTTQDKGVQLGISNGVNCYGVAYDPAMFAKAGVPEPKENWTWDDYKNACMTIHDKLGIYGSSKFDDFIGGCTMGISQVDYNLNFFAPSNDKLGFDDYTLLTDYLQMRADLTNAGAYPDPGAIAEIKDIQGDYLATGEAAMTWVASNQFIALSEAAGRELKLVPAPRRTADGPSGSTIQSSQMFCVSKDSKHPEEAAKFLNFFWTDGEANKILNGERGISIFSNVLEAQATEMTDKQNTVNEFVKLIGSYKTGSINVISPAQKTEIEDNYKLLVEKVIYGDMTADEAAKSCYDFAKSKFE
ncbi:MAG TPA: extracellular solute-binding protein [Mobilitalea sp.]|nr:extracellular solute-binding protein [Mobilitalea sp.]